MAGWALECQSLAFPRSLLRALRQVLGRRESSYADTLLALLIREGGSTSEHRNGLCAVAPVSHAYLGATASDLGSVGECANGRSLSVYWCQDGKSATNCDIPINSCCATKMTNLDEKLTDDEMREIIRETDVV